MVCCVKVLCDGVRVCCVKVACDGVRVCCVHDV